MLMKRKESELQVHVVEVTCSHIQSLWVFVLEQANSFMSLVQGSIDISVWRNVYCSYDNGCEFA